MSSVRVSSSSLAGLSAISLRHPGGGPPLAVRVVETPTARLVERLASRASARAQRDGRALRLDLDDLIARAEGIAGPRTTP